MTPRLYPALDLDWPAAQGDDETAARILAAADDWSPSAVEDRPHGLRVFFAADDARAGAAAALEAMFPGMTVARVEVSDESWAERSQADLQPVTVDRLVIAPPWVSTEQAGDRIWIPILPSMGFGTGHHASTRLCLRLLQEVELAGRAVADVGTGSGVLAIAARRLGAARVVALDYDEDAIDAARDNVARNAVAGPVTVSVADLSRHQPVGWGSYDLVLANLTGALLVRLAATLVAGLVPAGSLIVSGLENSERRDVLAAFERVGANPVRDREEDGWLGLHLRLGPSPDRPDGR